MICFSTQVTTVSTYLKGPGGEAGDGLPLPRDARIYRIDCWDGTVLTSDTGNESASQGDRLSVYAAYSAGSFTVTVRVNGVDTAIEVTGISSGVTLMVTVYFKLI